MSCTGQKPRALSGQTWPARSFHTAKESITMRKSLKTSITLATTGALVLGGAAFG
ncbi:hypothetical protein ACVKXF_003473, partial [Curtobacterium sp. PvP017]